MIIRQFYHQIIMFSEFSLNSFNIIDYLFIIIIIYIIKSILLLIIINFISISNLYYYENIIIKKISINEK